MDGLSEPFVGRYLFLSHEALNLLITGKACSNSHNETQQTSLSGLLFYFSDGVALKGVTEQADIGFLTTMEYFKYVNVGYFVQVSISMII